MDTLRLRSVTATAVDVPMKRPLVTSVQTIRSAPMVLVDLLTEEGVTGRAYVFCYLRRLAPAVKAALAEIDALCTGAALAPRDLFSTIKRHFRLVGATGIVNTAIAGFDMACWDAVARAAGQPLGRLLGGGRGSLPAYNSNGLGMSAPEALADEALALLEGGFKAIKIRLGRADPAADLAAVRLAINIDAAGLRGTSTAFSGYGLPAGIDLDPLRQRGLVEGPPWPMSDHMVFAMAGRPAIALTSDALERVLDEVAHTPGDVPDLVDTALLEQAAQAVAEMVRSGS